MAARLGRAAAPDAAKDLGIPDLHNDYKGEAKDYFTKESLPTEEKTLAHRGIDRMARELQSCMGNLGPTAALHARKMERSVRAGHSYTLNSAADEFWKVAALTQLRRCVLQYKSASTAMKMEVWHTVKGFMEMVPAGTWNGQVVYFNDMCISLIKAGTPEEIRSKAMVAESDKAEAYRLGAMGDLLESV